MTFVDTTPEWMKKEMTKERNRRRAAERALADLGEEMDNLRDDIIGLKAKHQGECE